MMGGSNAPVPPQMMGGSSYAPGAQQQMMGGSSYEPGAQQQMMGGSSYAPGAQQQMMGGSSYAPGPQQLAVISPQYCVGYPVDLTIARKLMTLLEGSFGVTDANGNLMFRVKSKLFSLHDRRVLYDAAAKPLINFHQKWLSPHRKWVVYRGESTNTKDLLFSVKKSSILPTVRTKLDVFLASNTSHACDFRIEGSWFERSCIIYSGKSSNVVAQMHRKYTAQSVILGKDTFGLTVYPNVDQAFIVALVVILEEINEDRSGDD